MNTLPPLPEPGVLAGHDRQIPAYTGAQMIDYARRAIQWDDHECPDNLAELHHALGCQLALYRKLQTRFDQQHAQLGIWKKKFKDLGGTKKADLIRKLADKLSVKEKENIALRHRVAQIEARSADAAAGAVLCYRNPAPNAEPPTFGWPPTVTVEIKS